MYLPEGGEKGQWVTWFLIGGATLVCIFFFLLYLAGCGHISWDLGEYILSIIGK